MQDLEHRSDEELEKETRHRAAAQALLGARAAQRYDAPRARSHFERAIAAARPQERMQIRRMMQASMALAERRPGDLKSAVEKLGQEAPSGRQLLMLRVLGIVAPPKSAGTFARVRGILAVVLFVVALILVAFGIVSLIAWPLGGLSTGVRFFWAFMLILAILVGLFVVGRRRQKRAAAGGAAPPAR